MSRKKVIVLMQGGGGLGAFQCGVWKALYPYLVNNEYEVSVLLGSSIGAVNAAFIAQHYHDIDGGVGRLEQFWRKEIALTPVPFLPVPGDYWHYWNSLMTALLLGHSGLFTPMYQNWNLLAATKRFSLPLYDTSAFEKTLAKSLNHYKGKSPLLAVRTTDVMNGRCNIFSSDRGTIDSRILLASCSIPIMFPPVEIEGHYHWDGDMNSYSLLPDALHLIQDNKDNEAEPDRYLVVIVNLHQPVTDKKPESAMECSYRLLNIIFGTKPDSDISASRSINSHIDFLRKAKELVQHLPESELTKMINNEHDKMIKERKVHLDFLHIGRDNLPYEHISKILDFSPKRINELIEQGFINANKAISQYSNTLHDCDLLLDSSK